MALLCCCFFGQFLQATETWSVDSVFQTRSNILEVNQPSQDKPYGDEPQELYTLTRQPSRQSTSNPFGDQTTGNDGPLEPGAQSAPVGDVPVLFMLFLSALYVLVKHLRSHQIKRRGEGVFKYAYKKEESSLIEN